MEQFQKRNTWIRMRLTAAEMQAIEELSQQANCRTKSEYARKMLLKKPRVVHHQDESLKTFLHVMLELKRTLNEITANMTLAAEQLSSPAQSPQIRMWSKITEQDVTRFQKKIDDIFQTADKIYNLWSQE